MMMAKLHRTAAIIAACLLLPAMAHAAGRIRVLGAENFYADVARQIGGPSVTVSGILNNPDVDPHLYEVSPSVARDVATAQIVIYNGIDYDPWITKLLSATHNSHRIVIDVATLIGKRTGDNPHIWYDPRTMPTLATRLASVLGEIDPTHRLDYIARAAAFRQSMELIDTKIAELRKRLEGVSVTATEPVFGYMLQALGLRIRNNAFQLSVMNNTEPSARDVATFEDDLRKHRVKLLVYNGQASDPIATRMRALARASGVPIIAVTETEPQGVKYQTWMIDTLRAVDRALPKAQ
jgi:zinc/manganese transport system substrate-binding protein